MKPNKTTKAACKHISAFLEEHWKLSDGKRIVATGKPDKAGFRRVKLKECKREYPKAMRIFLEAKIDGKLRRFCVEMRDVTHHFNLKP